MKRGLGQRLERTLGAAEPQPEPTFEADLRAFGRELDRHARWRSLADAVDRSERHPLDLLIPCEHVETPYGEAMVVRERLPLTSSHGALVVGTLFDLGHGHLEQVVGDARLDGFDPADALFLDIEASGLEHGAGTYAFVIGLGYLQGDHFVIDQLVLRGPEDEQAVLQLLVEALDAKPYLVSFNGKSYDLTVLQGRLVIHRFYTHREVDLKLRPHLDLLHLARNLYRGFWPDTKLQTLEARLLGFERTDDVPGSLVPSIWYHYQRTGDAEPMLGVIEHNRHDVLSMVTLAERLVSGSAPDSASLSERDPRLLANLGRTLLRRRAPEAALPVLRAAAEAQLSGPWRREALHQLAAAARRCRDAGTLRESLESLVDSFGDDRAARIALAILDEREGRLAEALAHTRVARGLAPDAAIARRIERLETRIARKQS